MTRKQAKEACGYTPTPTLRVCKNCASFAVDRVLPAWIVEHNKTLADKDKYTVEENGVEKNARCVTGGFPVKKMGSCDNWKGRG